MLFSKPNDTTDGARAEALAASYLSRHGLRIEARNFRVRGGEIDLVCRDGPTLVFVEVRQRRSLAQGGAAASIVSAKQRRIVFAARHFLARLASLPPCRFDAVLLQGRLDGPEPPAIEWLQAAFDAG